MPAPLARREFLGSLLAPALARAAAPRPNIVFILADDLGWTDTTPYGADFHQTPNLERLAAQGVLFRRAYTAAPVCTPTRASILTGKHPARLQMTIWRESARHPPLKNRLMPPLVAEDLPHSETTLAEVLHEAGYFTAHVGKWHLGGATHYPETQGFDVNIGGTQWGAPQSFFWPYSGTRYYGGEFRYVPGLHGGQPGEYLTDRLTTEALNAIGLAKDRPFFLNLWYHTVHTPIEGKPELVERYRKALRPEHRHRNATYAAMVHSMDENVGRVLDYLDRRGLAQNTIVVFTSDNGGYINPWQGEPVTTNHPLRSGKGSLYEGGLRVPLIVRGPGLGRGAVSEASVCSTDFFPTLLEEAGLPRSVPDGLSLSRLLRDPKARLGRDTLFFHYPHYYATTTPVSAVLSGQWKLLEYFEDGRLELYDLSRDPGETRDLASQEKQTAARLHARLREWRAQVNAPMPKPNPDFR
jgi:arylsulfatase A-like enzyme